MGDLEPAQLHVIEAVGTGASFLVDAPPGSDVAGTLAAVFADAAASARPSTHTRTLVFDEIDAGVGGRAAREIGRRLERLARPHQVIVVTHLAQVAAWADTHLVVRKETVPDPVAASAAGPVGGEAAPTSLVSTYTRPRDN